LDLDWLEVPPAESPKTTAERLCARLAKSAGPAT